MDTIVFREDCIINDLEQSESGLLDAVTVAFPGYRETGKHALTYDPLTGSAADKALEDTFTPKITYEAVDDHTVLYTVSRSS